MESTPDSVFRSDAVKYALIGLMRDLRGIAMATNRLVDEQFLNLFIFDNPVIWFCFSEHLSVAEHMGFYLIGYIQRTCHFS